MTAIQSCLCNAYVYDLLEGLLLKGLGFVRLSIKHIYSKISCSKALLSFIFDCSVKSVTLLLTLGVRCQCK